MSAPEHGSIIDGVVRQSALRTFDACPLAAHMEMQGFQDWSTDRQAVGTAFHLVAEEMLRTMKEHEDDERPDQISTQEAVEIMYEVVAKPECPHLSDDELRELLGIVLNFCAHKWTARLIVALEERLWADVPCPDGQTRKITGKPDVLMAYAPGVALVIDFKTGWNPPPAPRSASDPAIQPDGTIVGEKYLSERGHFQLDTLGLLTMRTYPKINEVVLREFHARINETREAVLHRDNLEHVERRLGVLAQRFEAMVETGEAEPRPGTHCSYCPASVRCPIKPERRGAGMIESEKLARASADALCVVDSQRDDLRKATKAWVDANGPIEIPGGIVGWKVRDSGSRAFGIWKEGQ